MENANYDALRFWWEVAMTLGVLGNFLYQWVISRDRVNKKAIEEVKAQAGKANEDTVKKVGGMNERLVRVEERIKSLPDEEDIEKLYVRLNQVDTEMHELLGKLDSTNHLLDVLHKYMLNKKE